MEFLNNVGFSGFLLKITNFTVYRVSKLEFFPVAKLILIRRNVHNFVFATNIYLFKVNNISARKKFKLCSTLSLKITERHWRRSIVFIVPFEDNSYLFLVFLLLTLNWKVFAGFVQQILERYMLGKKILEKIISRKSVLMVPISCTSKRRVTETGKKLFAQD